MCRLDDPSPANVAPPSRERSINCIFSAHMHPDVPTPPRPFTSFASSPAFFCRPVLLLLFTTMACTCVLAQNEKQRSEITPSAYRLLPLGDVRPEGYLKETLRRMGDGMTGKLDSLYPEVVGPRNGWLGGDGDGWERGPYWIDGLLPLAYLLDDAALKAKALAYVDWTLDNQAADGYLGPVPFEEDPGYEPGLQRTQRRDWWPKMVMLKVLRQYYEATEDERVLPALHRYFRYQLQKLPNRPLDADTFWANRRGADNLQVVLWLYELSGEDYLLELAEMLREQTFPWDRVFTNEPTPGRPEAPGSFGISGRYPFDSTAIAKISLADQGTIHCVNIAQGLKQPAVLYHLTGEERYLEALERGINDLKKYHGQVQGMYGGDEPLHGDDPTQGIEFCAISEAMFSLESIVQLTGNVEMADLLERITYNALPTQAADDFSGRQYFQAANQIELKRHVGNSFENRNHHGTDFVYGERTGYPCCTTNMHQSWPKFVRNLFYGTAGGGVAALQYGPASASLTVGDGAQASIRESGGYPFREQIRFDLTLDRPADFAFDLRIPHWAEGATVQINEEAAQAVTTGTVAQIERRWEDGDVLILHLPMRLTVSTWFEFSQAVERGPLVFALGVPGRYTRQVDENYGPYTEVTPTAPWNFGLLRAELDKLNNDVTVEEVDWDGRYPWTLSDAPLRLRMPALRVPEWQAEGGVPHLPAFWGGGDRRDSGQVEEITLVPYGCTELRIAQFPVY